MTVSKPPPGLALRGRRLWHQLTVAFELTDVESEILVEVCQTADLVDRLASALADAELVVAGSRGQAALNPLAAELRQQRDLLGRLLGRLALPSDNDGQP